MCQEQNIQDPELQLEKYIQILLFYCNWSSKSIPGLPEFNNNNNKKWQFHLCGTYRVFHVLHPITHLSLEWSQSPLTADEESITFDGAD